jgi:ATP adenylyltransferase
MVSLTEMTGMSSADDESETTFAGASLERLWTPWRREYVTGTPSAACFLCSLAAAASADDEANLVLHREAGVLVLLNRYPYNPGHLLVAPYSHTGDFAGLEPGLRDVLFALVQRGTAALVTSYEPGGFNVGMNLGRVAGAGVPDHLHLHVVPRWAADSNFMTVTAETRVLPETLAETYRRLRPLFP